MAGTTPKFNLTRLLNERSREAAVQENKEEKTAEIGHAGRRREQYR